MPGTIFDMKVDHGQLVKEDEPLLVMRNPDLAIQIEEVRGQLEAASEELRGIYSRLNDATSRYTDSEKAQAEAQFGRLKIQVESYREQLELLKSREARLTVRSPIPGRVITWDAKKMLENRPVETGQVLLTVAAENSDYEIKLYMPERRARHLQRARDALQAKQPDADLKVDYILMTEPGRTYYGEVIEVGDTTESHEEHGNYVPVRVKPDDSIAAGRPGATVTADVHCGTAPLGWTLLHEAWEWLEGNVFF